MRQSKKQAKKRKAVIATSGIVAGVATVIATGASVAMKYNKKKLYEDSMEDVKTSEEIL